MKPGAVFAAYLHDGDQVSHSFMQSVMSMDRSMLWGGNLFGRLTRAGGIPDGRRDMTTHFLDETDAEWLWFVDTDMGWEPDALRRLLAAADPERVPVLGAYCVSLRHGAPDGAGGFHVKTQSTVYQHDGIGFLHDDVSPDLAAEPVHRVAGTGAAFLLIHRGALLEMSGRFGASWWAPRPAPEGRLLGEDLSFCERAAEVRVPVHVHLGVRTTHAKRVWLS